jgi:hypothetical protein
VRVGVFIMIGGSSVRADTLNLMGLKSSSLIPCYVEWNHVVSNKRVPLIVVPLNSNNECIA